MDAAAAVLPRGPEEAAAVLDLVASFDKYGSDGQQEGEGESDQRQQDAGADDAAGDSTDGRSTERRWGHNNDGDGGGGGDKDDNNDPNNPDPIPDPNNGDTNIPLKRYRLDGRCAADPRRWQTAAGVVLLAVAVAAAAAVPAEVGEGKEDGDRRPQRRRRQPSILFLLTDDQDALIGGTDHMRGLRKHLAAEGTTFNRAFVHTPVCCPSRSSILSGRYIHNGGAIANSMQTNCYGGTWIEETERDAFAPNVKAVAPQYRTAYLGKYLNEYPTGKWTVEVDKETKRFLDVPDDEKVVPPGWDRWYGVVGNAIYYGYQMVRSDDGGKTKRIEKHKWDYGKDYLPNLIANETIRLIEEFSRGEEEEGEERPFLIVAAYPTPHTPFQPAPQYKDTLVEADGYRAHRTPNWNASWESNQNKHWFLRQFAAIDGATEEWIDNAYRRRHEMLQSVDDHIGSFVEALRRTGRLDDTFIVYTSDNGFQLGQHRIRGDKRQLYEHDIRVPLVVRGPGVPRGHVDDEHIVLNIDYAATLVDIATNAAATATSTVGRREEEQEPAATAAGGKTKAFDGRSFLPILRGQGGEVDDGGPEWRTDFLVSYHGEAFPCGRTSCKLPKALHAGDATNNTYNCVREWVTPRDSGSASSGTGGRRNTIYCRFVDDENFTEYYDLDEDPWQLNNTASLLSTGDVAYFEARLAQLRSCRGRSCWANRQSPPRWRGPLPMPGTSADPITVAMAEVLSKDGLAVATDDRKLVLLGIQGACIVFVALFLSLQFRRCARLGPATGTPPRPVTATDLLRPQH